MMELNEGVTKEEAEVVCSQRDIQSKNEAALELQNSRKCDKFRAEKFQNETKKHWDLFYKRNETRFFKDRHWTTREFQELIEDESTDKVLLEVGCGVGNFAYPLLEESSSLFIYACDLSPRAVEMVKTNPSYNTERIKAFECDISIEDCFKDNIPDESVDIVSLIFVLSAIRPSLFKKVIENLHRVLKPGGLLIFRDYAIDDMAMYRFKKGTKIDERHYLRQDGTTSYFFTIQELQEIVQEVGFTIQLNEYVERRTINKKEDLDVARIFLQGKYRKL